MTRERLKTSIIYSSLLSFKQRIEGSTPRASETISFHLILIILRLIRIISRGPHFLVKNFLFAISKYNPGQDICEQTFYVHYLCELNLPLYYILYVIVGNKSLDFQDYQEQIKFQPTNFLKIQRTEDTF